MDVVIPGARIAREPGTQEHGPEESTAWPVFMGSGLARRAVPA